MARLQTPRHGMSRCFHAISSNWSAVTPAARAVPSLHCEVRSQLCAMWHHTEGRPRDGTPSSKSSTTSSTLAVCRSSPFLATNSFPRSPKGRRRSRRAFESRTRSTLASRSWKRSKSTGRTHTLSTNGFDCTAPRMPLHYPGTFASSWLAAMVSPSHATRRVVALVHCAPTLRMRWPPPPKAQWPSYCRCATRRKNVLSVRQCDLVMNSSQGM